MQRSIAHKNPVEISLYLLLFILYSSLSSIYPFLPPMLAVLFVLFSKALTQGDTSTIIIVSFTLVIFEANNGYTLFSSIIYFYILHKFILSKIKQNVSCPECIGVISTLLVYLGYFLFLTLIANIFLLNTPEISYYVIYYMVIEFFFVSLL